MLAAHLNIQKPKEKMTEQLNVPASSGGLVRYFDEYKSRFQLKPEVVVGMILAVIAFTIAIRFILPIN